jgi:hypothetical protein
MDINKLINSLSDESKKELLEKIKMLDQAESASEQPTQQDKTSFKRHRKSKKHTASTGEQEIIMPDSPAPQQKTNKKARFGGPVNNVEHVNKFETSSFKNQERQDIQFDKLIKKSVTPRGDRSTVLEMQCRDCNKRFSVSAQLVKHDGDEYYYVCNRCMKRRN